MAMLECPSIRETTGIGMPPCNMIDAARWRRSWNRVAVSPLAATCRANALDTENGTRPDPPGAVNTRPVSVHASPHSSRSAF